MLRQQVGPWQPLASTEAHQSIAPTLLGWQLGNDWRMGFIAVGSVLILVARKTLPLQSSLDSPHGQELLQAVWGWVQQRLKGKP